MKPIFPEPREGFERVVLAKDQPEYLQLPANYDGMTVETVWKMTLRERLTSLFSGKVYVDILTFGKPMQPVRVSMERYDGTNTAEIEPLEAEDMPQPTKPNEE